MELIKVNLSLRTGCVARSLNIRFMPDGCIFNAIVPIRYVINMAIIINTPLLSGLATAMFKKSRHHFWFARDLGDGVHA